MKIIYALIGAVLHCFWLSAQDPLVVFPGDYNNDGIVNHYDILPLGIAMFHEGFPREPASTAWEGQVLDMPWPQFLPVSDINYGFIDGDGNGWVSPDDLDVIVLNYDSTQTGALPPPQPYLPQALCETCAPALIVVSFDQSAVFTGDTITGSISIVYPPGTPASAGAAGLAFNVLYNEDWIVESSLEVWPDTSGDDLMFIAATVNQVQGFKSSTPGMMELGAASKTGTQTIHESRTLFYFRSIVEDLIIRAEDDTIVVPFTLEISDLMMLNILEENVPFSVQHDTVWLHDPVTPVCPTSTEISLIVIPNPASHEVSVFTENLRVSSWTLYSSTGHIAGTGRGLEQYSYIIIPVHHLSTGYYTLVFQTSEGIITRSLLRI